MEATMYNRRGMMGGTGMGVILQHQRTLSYLQGSSPNIRRTLRGVAVALRPYRWHALGGTFLMLCTVALGLIPPLLLRQLIDEAIPHDDLRQIFLLGGCMVVFPVLGALLSLAQNYISTL